MEILKTKQMKFEWATYRLIVSTFGLLFTFFNGVKAINESREFAERGWEELSSRAMGFSVFMFVMAVLFIGMILFVIIRGKQIPNEDLSLTIYEDRIVKKKKNREIIVKFEEITKLIDQTEVWGQIQVRTSEGDIFLPFKIFNVYDVKIDEIYKIINKQYANLKD